MGRKKIDHDKTADLLLNGATYTDALTLGGFSEKQARKGSAIVRKNKKLQEALIRAGRAMSPETRAALATGRLIANVTEGVDRATQSIKLLGQDKDVRMWESENQSNTVIIQPSPEMEAEILRSMQKELDEEEEVKKKNRDQRS